MSSCWTADTFVAAGEFAAPESSLTADDTFVDIGSMKYVDDVVSDKESSDDDSEIPDKDEFVSKCVSSLADDGDEAVDTTSVSPASDVEYKFVAVASSAPGSLTSSLDEGGGEDKEERRTGGLKPMPVTGASWRDLRWDALSRLLVKSSTRSRANLDVDVFMVRPILITLRSYGR